MEFEAVIALAVLGIAMGAQLMRRSFLLRATRPTFYASSAVIFGAVFYRALRQYADWSEGAITKFLLPPYQTLDYFYSYAGYKFFAPWLVALAAAIFIASLAAALNRKCGGRFFHGEEIGFLRLGVFLTGYPGFLFYLAFVIFAELLLSLFYMLTARGRAPLYYLWIPLAIGTVLAEKFFIPASLLKFFTLG